MTADAIHAMVLRFARCDHEALMWERCIAWTAAQNPPIASFWRRQACWDDGTRMACAETISGETAFEALISFGKRQAGLF